MRRSPKPSSRAVLSIARLHVDLSVGVGLETATRSHVCRAMQEGATAQEIEQAVLLACNT